MHIPETFLSLPVMVSTNLLSAGLMLPAVKKLNRHITPSRIPLMGISAAFVFTVQLLSIPIGGTSVHMSGALLIAILLGPWSGMIITASAIILQAFLFQHGGLLTLGANILNIAVIQSLLGYGIFTFIKKRNRILAVIFAVMITKIVAAVFCTLQLVLSEQLELVSGLIAMISSQSLGGVVEVITTLFILGFIGRLRSELLDIDKI